MGRSISVAASSSSGASYFNPAWPLDGPFGNGKIIYFMRSTTFTVPTGITTVRARVWGAGGGSDQVQGGTSSFGAYCSATGGGSAGGTGSGGDINTTGGSRPNNASGGGGGAANLFGDGGAGGEDSHHGVSGTSGGGGGRGAMGGRGIAGQGGRASHFYNAGSAANPTGGQTDPVSPLGNILGQFSIDLIGCGGGGGQSANGWNGGGGGCGYQTGGWAGQGAGGFPGGGAGSLPQSQLPGAGGGFAIKTITGLSAGTNIAVTIGQSGNAFYGGANGLVIVEY